MENCNVFSIFLGDAKTLVVKATQPHCACDQVTNGVPNYDPIDLTDVTNIAISLPNADGSYTVLTLADSQVSVVGSPLLGTFQAPISSAASALLMTGLFQSIDVTFTFSGSNIFTVNFPQVLSVMEMR